MMKRTTALLVSAGLLCLTLAGCGAEAPTDKPADQGTANNGAAPIRLEFYQQKSEIIDLYDELIQKFNAANPDIIVEQVAVPDSETALLSRVATNDVPDILSVYPAETFYREMMAEGLLLDLSNEAFLPRADEATLKLSDYEGKSYAMPVTLSAYGIYYNKDIFDAHNLVAPKTYDELLSVCKTLQAAGVQPFTFRDKGGVAQEAERMSGVINNDVSSVFERVAKGETSFTKEPEIRALAETMLTLRTFGQKDTLGTGAEQAISDFVTGKAAMFISGSWIVSDVLVDQPELNVELIPIPSPLAAETKVPVNIDTAYSISASLEQPEAALKFLDFLTSPEVAQYFAEKEGTPNIIKGVKNEAKQLASINALITEGKYFMTPANYWPAGMRNNWEAPIQELIMTRDVEKFLQATDAMAKEFYAQS